jgi:hypothetical protein
MKCYKGDFKMNIYDILRKIGYDIISFSEGVYEVEFSPERKRRMREQIKSGETVFNFDIDTSLKLKVGDVGFNNLGNLYVFFNNAEDTDECLDAYEHCNMSAEELYTY